MDLPSILKQTELFRDLDDDVINTIASRALPKRLERNEILFVAGEAAAGLYVVCEGSVRAFRSDADGREQVIHVEHAVATIAEVPVFDGGSYPSTVAAEKPSQLLFISREDITKVSRKYPEVAFAAAKLLASRLRRCAELVETLSLREVGQRIALQLLREASASGLRSETGVTFSHRQTHNQMAATIGTVREVVTRAMRRLEESGLIKISGRNIVIPDVPALQRYAGQYTGNQ